MTTKVERELYEKYCWLVMSKWEKTDRDAATVARTTEESNCCRCGPSGKKKVSDVIQFILRTGKSEADRVSMCGNTEVRKDTKAASTQMFRRHFDQDLLTSSHQNGVSSLPVTVLCELSHPVHFELGCKHF